MATKRVKESARGEGLVWLTAMGITVGIVMIVFMIGLIMYKGLDVFWPKEVLLVELAEELPDERRLTRRHTTFAGVIAEERMKMGREINEDGTIKPPVPEVQYFVGNRELYQTSFFWVAEEDIAATAPLEGAIRIERTEFGDVLALPLRIQYDEEQPIPADSDAFHPTMRQALDEVNDLRDRIRTLDKGKIGPINSKMERIRLELRGMDRAERDGDPANEARREELLAQRDSLQSDFDALAVELDALRAELHHYHLTYQLPSGSEHQISFGEIIDYYFPNELGFFQKVGVFTNGLWRFITEEPREANTEGGIWPAIFGTFVMTVLMSLMVTPLGVVAAIYLREYARQGPLVRMVRIAINNLAGVPSIVFGVFGLGFFVWGMGGRIDELFFPEMLPTATFGGGGILWASLTLALLTVPVVIVASEEALAAVPRGTREGALACGASHWQTIQRVVLPAAAPGVLTGVILAMARGAGEVAPLMLVGVVKLAPTLPINSTYPYVHLEQQFMHLGFHIYDLGFQSPDSEAAKPMVFATTFLLITLVVVLNLSAIIIREHLRRKYATSAF